MFWPLQLWCSTGQLWSSLILFYPLSSSRDHAPRPKTMIIALIMIMIIMVMTIVLIMMLNLIWPDMTMIIMIMIVIISWSQPPSWSSPSSWSWCWSWCQTLCWTWSCLLSDAPPPDSSLSRPATNPVARWWSFHGAAHLMIMIMIMKTIWGDDASLLFKTNSCPLEE